MTSPEASPEESTVISGANKPVSALCCEDHGNKAQVSLTDSGRAGRRFIRVVSKRDFPRWGALLHIQNDPGIAETWPTCATEAGVDCPCCFFASRSISAGSSSSRGRFSP